MQQQQEDQLSSDVVGPGRGERRKYVVGKRSVDIRSYVRSSLDARGIGTGGIDARDAGRRQSHADLLERVHRW